MIEPKHQNNLKSMSTHLKPFRKHDGQYMMAMNQGVENATPVYYTLAVGNSDHLCSHTVQIDTEAFQKMARDMATYLQHMNGEDRQRIINASRFLREAVEKINA